MAHTELHPYATELTKALQELEAATRAAWATGQPQEALANAVPDMQAFGHTVLAWVWLDIACKVLEVDASISVTSNAGRISATRYFYHYELPRITAWLRVVSTRDMTCAQMPVEAF